ncbi:FadR/GntR family transcriptional regulator [Amycolatopsis rubida]|nr:FCD domain-containing protein [Amycolatopsis rubida]
MAELADAMPSVNGALRDRGDESGRAVRGGAEHRAAAEGDAPGDDPVAADLGECARRRSRRRNRRVVSAGTAGGAECLRCRRIWRWPRCSGLVEGGSAHAAATARRLTGALLAPYPRGPTRMRIAVRGVLAGNPEWYRLARPTCLPIRRPRTDRGRPMTSKQNATPGEKGGTRRLAEKVSEQIEKDIIDGGWRVGSVLGSETELIERYGVSRAVFREAVRLVEHQQMAAMRRGPGGGLVVTEPDPGVVRNAARVYLRHAEVNRQQLMQARTALEVAGIALAAENLTESGIVRLKEALESERELIEQGFTRGHARNLHRVIAELAGNPAITLFVEVLAQLDQDIVQREWDAESAGGEHRDAARESHEAHEAIVAALVAGDAPLGQHRMRRHLQAIAALLRPEA